LRYPADVLSPHTVTTRGIGPAARRERRPRKATRLPPHPRQSGGRSFRDLLIGRVRITLPPGLALGDLTRQHPEASFHLVDRIPTGDGRTILVRFEVDGLNPAVIERKLYTNRQVAEVWLAAAGPGRRTFVVRCFNPPYMVSLQRFAVLRWLPITIRDGVADWTVLCPRVEWQPFIADLRTRVPQVDILGVGVRSLRDPESPLTRRQAQVYRQAVLEGYYEIPRRISLTGLAAKLRTSKSTICEVLARAEGKMLRTDLATALPPSIDAPAGSRRPRAVPEELAPGV
jgi:HTH DNA binding domain